MARWRRRVTALHRTQADVLRAAASHAAAAGCDQGASRSWRTAGSRQLGGPTLVLRQLHVLAAHLLQNPPAAQPRRVLYRAGWGGEGWGSDAPWAASRRSLERARNCALMGSPLSGFCSLQDPVPKQAPHMAPARACVKACASSSRGWEAASSRHRSMYAWEGQGAPSAHLSTGARRQARVRAQPGGISVGTVGQPTELAGAAAHCLAHAHTQTHLDGFVSGDLL